ncbi:hypothetical protein [Bradyrhizobium prioriisuperbiae]|uniref:hypothetical protein n=1 Tax=Bradyrhizobium prioriisuperbiae TaxID=2854389 RepID=UPI0028ED6833|nr:hypothetical protein [Bradyrhizobium prioritasuperba]
MAVRRLLSCVFAVLVTAGLVLAPLALPAAAQRLSPTAMMPMADMTADASDASAMMADMPCCPDQQKNNGCQDCPLIAICMLKVLQAGPSVAASPQKLIIRETLHPHDDVVADGLTRPPPDQPPRFLA